MRSKLKIEDLTPSLFWDVNRLTLDPEKHKRYIIERVLTRGKLEDWFLIKKHYGKATIEAESIRFHRIRF